MHSLLHARHCAMDYIYYLINSQGEKIYEVETGFVDIL